MNTQIHYNTIEEDDMMNNKEEDTLSLSDLQIEDDNTTHSEQEEEGSKANQSPSSSSSSATSSFDQDFLGFFSEEWSRHDLYDNNNNNASPPAENIIFCGKVVSSKSKPSVVAAGGTMNSQITRPVQLLLRSSDSDSFRFVKRRQISTPRSKSLPNRSCKWQVFVFGLGSGKFPTTMDMSDIKSRQLRRQTSSSTVTVSEYNQQEKTKSVGQRSSTGKKKKGWWRLVDVLGCSGGYEIETSHHVRC